MLPPGTLVILRMTEAPHLRIVVYQADHGTEDQDEVMTFVGADTMAIVVGSGGSVMIAAIASTWPHERVQVMLSNGTIGWVRTTNARSV